MAIVDVHGINEREITFNEKQRRPKEKSGPERYVIKKKKIVKYRKTRIRRCRNTGVRYRLDDKYVLTYYLMLR